MKVNLNDFDINKVIAKLMIAGADFTYALELGNDTRSYFVNRDSSLTELDMELYLDKIEDTLLVERPNTARQFIRNRAYRKALDDFYAKGV